MTTPLGTDRLITTWLEEQAPMREPDGLLDSVVTQLESTRRLPGWVYLERWIPMQTRAKFGAIPRTAIVLVTLAVLAVLLGAVALAGSLPAPRQAPPPPFGPAANGLIAYEHLGDIYVADPDGSNPRAITSGPEQDWGPYFSRDGSKLMFARGLDPNMREMLASPDGSGAIELATGSVQGVEFLPDGRAVLIHTVNDRNVLSIDDMNGSELRTLDIGDIEPLGTIAVRPPDGTKLIFGGRVHYGQPDRAMYEIGVDGTGLRMIGDVAPTDSVDGAAPSTATYSLQDLVISPDGNTVAYSNWETSPTGSPSASLYLHLRDLETGEELPVAIKSTVWPYTGYLPRFSPDGTKMVFEEVASSHEQIWYGPIDGSTPAAPIGPAFAWDDRVAFDFSPDGTKVLLGLRPPAVSVIIDLATGATTPMPDVSSWSWQRLAMN